MSHGCKLIACLTTLYCLIACNLYAQALTSAPHRGVQQLPIGHEAYTFLRHLSVRGVIEGYSEVQLPISEYEATEFLRSADTTKLSMNERELRLKYLQQTSSEPYPATTVFGGDSTKPFLRRSIFTAGAMMPRSPISTLMALRVLRCAAAKSIIQDRQFLVCLAEGCSVR
jgi:hypothetical protein